MSTLNVIGSGVGRGMACWTGVLDGEWRVGRPHWVRAVGDGRQAVRVIIKVHTYLCGPRHCGLNVRLSDCDDSCGLTVRVMAGASCYRLDCRRERERAREVDGGGCSVQN